MILPASVFLVWAALVPAAQKKPADDLTLRTVDLPGIEVRFVNFHWRPELFEAMEKGGGTMPEAKRSWMLARIVTGEPFTLEGKKVPVGNYALGLWPNLDGKGLAIELRRVDMGTVLVRDVMAQLPRGDTYYKAAAPFETTADIAPRLGIQLGQGEQDVKLQIRYGNRRLSLTFVR
jgi:hypothetical protein